MNASELRALVEAFNDHDLDRIMVFFTDDCVLETPRGSEPWGTRFAGMAEVREGIAARFTGIPDVHYGDLFDLAHDGRIQRKDSHWKLVT